MAQGLSNASNTENIYKEVQQVYSGTSDRFSHNHPKNIFNMNYQLQLEDSGMWSGGKNFVKTKKIN